MPRHSAPVTADSAITLLAMTIPSIAPVRSDRVERQDACQEQCQNRAEGARDDADADIGIGGHVVDQDHWQCRSVRHDLSPVSEQTRAALPLPAAAPHSWLRLGIVVVLR